MTDIEMLPCPFCGDVEHLCVEHLEGTSIHPAYRVRCDSCGASTRYTDRDCRIAWNTRANVAHATAAKDAEIEALRAERDSFQRVGIREQERADHLQAELDNRWAQGVHTCHDKCQRIACVLRRDNKRLAEALRDLLIDVTLAQSNMRRAAKTDPRWEGCAEAIQPRVDAALAALRDHDQEPANDR